MYIIYVYHVYTQYKPKIVEVNMNEYKFKYTYITVHAIIWVPIGYYDYVIGI